jgi:hypothetical protein
MPSNPTSLRALVASVLVYHLEVKDSIPAASMFVFLLD